jgi:SusD family.
MFIYLRDDAVKGYLARFYFWTQQWDKAISYSSEIISKYPLIGIEEYKSMIKSVLGKNGNMILKSYVYATSSDLVNKSAILSMQDRPLSARFVRMFDENDVRKSLLFNSKRKTEKYPFSGIRTAEMLLIRAESYAHINNEEQALADINSLLFNRINNFRPYTLSSLPSTDNSEEIIKVDCTGKELTPLLSLILKERRKELFNEGDRWFELKRNGCPEFWSAQNGKKYVTQKFLYTFPLPIVDIELVDGLIQNDGYENIY